MPIAIGNRRSRLLLHTLKIKMPRFLHAHIGTKKKKEKTLIVCLVDGTTFLLLDSSALIFSDNSTAPIRSWTVRTLEQISPQQNCPHECRMDRQNCPNAEWFKKWKAVVCRIGWNGKCRIFKKREMQICLILVFLKCSQYRSNVQPSTWF